MRSQIGLPFPHLPFFNIFLECVLTRDETQGLLLTFFGPKGQDELDLKHFASFCTDLHAELVRLEFLHYDSKAQVSTTQLPSLFKHNRYTDPDQQCPSAGIHIRDEFCTQPSVSLQDANNRSLSDKDRQNA